MNEEIKQIELLAFDINKQIYGNSSRIYSAIPIMYGMYTKFLKINPLDSSWINRDRFIVTNSNIASLYAMLFYAGYSFTTEELKNNLNSITSGIDYKPFFTSDSIGVSIGLSFGERYLNKLIPQKMIDFNTYILLTANDLIDGLSYEAFSFAGSQKLNKLIVLYDSNTYKKDEISKSSFCEDISLRFKSMGFYTQLASIDNNFEDLERTIKNAKRNTLGPSFIEIKNNNIINIDMQNNNYQINEDLKDNITNQIRNRFNKYYFNWLEDKKQIPNFDNLLSNNLSLDNYNSNNILDIHKENNNIILYLSKEYKLFMGGSNYPSLLNNQIKINTKNDPINQSIYYSLRCESMGYISMGLSLLNISPYCYSLLSEVEKLKTAIKLSVINNYNINYIFYDYNLNKELTVDILNNLRSIPNNIVFRPFNSNELLYAWHYMLENKGVKSLIINSNPTIKVEESNIINGGYIISKENNNLDGIIIASGNDVNLALQVKKLLLNDNIDLRIISVPCAEVFFKSNSFYLNEIMPATIKRFIIEEGNSDIWHKIIYTDNYLFNSITLNKIKKDNYVTYISSKIKELLDK